MKSGFLATFLLVALDAHAQIDRAGNVLHEDGGGSGDGIIAVGLGIVIGAVIGAMYAKHKQSQGNEFATGGGAVIGGLIGMFLLPLLMIVFR